MVYCGRMLKLLAASILMLALVDIGVTRGEHVHGVVGVLKQLFGFVLHMGNGSLFSCDGRLVISIAFALAKTPANILDR